MQQWEGNCFSARGIIEFYLRESHADRPTVPSLSSDCMRILYVHERFGALAGAEANILTTATELKQRHHDVAILHGVPTGKSEAKWRETFSHAYDLEKGSTATIVKEAVSAFAPEVVYVHKMADLQVIEALLQTGVPLVRMVHDHDIYCMRSSRYNYFTRKICTRAAGPYCVFPCGAVIARNHNGPLPIKLASYSEKKREIALNQKFSRMIVVTTYMRDELLRNGFDARKIEIHSPAPRMNGGTVCSTFSDRNLILYAGQIIRGKGVDVLLESLALIKSPFECIILGDGSHRAYCEKLCRRLNLQDRVRFAGFVPQEELKNYYRECTAFTISSVWPEPFATVGLEVMRYGIPVVSFDVGGIKDWLINGFNGFLVPVMNRQEFALRIEDLLRNKDLARKMGEQGRKLVNDQYDFGKYITALEDMFTRVLQGKEEVPCVEHRTRSLQAAIKASAGVSV